MPWTIDHGLPTSSFIILRGDTISHSVVSGSLKPKKTVLKNYFVIAVRNLLRNRAYTLINITGLSIGVTSCIIIFLVFRYDLSFDTFHSQHKRIYRVVRDVKMSSGTVYNSAAPYTFPKAFRNDFEDIPLLTAIHYDFEMNVKVGVQKHTVSNVIFADSLFFRVFDFKALSGNPAAELAQPGKVFLTRSLAEKILKNEKQTTLKIGKSTEVEIAGIVEDPPPASHMDFSMIVSMPTLSTEFTGGLPLNEWDMSLRGMSYLVLPEGVTAASIEKRLAVFTKKYCKPESAARTTYRLQPLKDIHFSEQYFFNPGGPATVPDENLIVIAALGIFIVIIACINFIHLATALAINKSKEIGIRKTLGASRGQIARYFLGETLLITVFAVLLSLGITERALPWLNDFTGKELVLDMFGSPALMFFVLAVIVVVTLFSGFYPAVVLSGFNPVAVLKNRVKTQQGSGVAVRKTLVIFQFLIAQVLIIATLVISRQMDYLRTKPLGFDSEAVITLRLPDNKPATMEAFRSRLEGDQNIVSLTFASGAPTSANDFGTLYYLTEKGKEEAYDGVNVKPVDHHYMRTFGIKLKAGRWFTENDAPVSKGDRYVYVITEAAMKQLGFNNPGQILGKHLTTGVMGIEGEIVGVVEDFHVRSLHTEMKPVVLMNFPFLYYEAGIRIRPGRIREALAGIEAQWETTFPDHDFEYEFLDEHLSGLYRSEERTFALFRIFAGISIFIGCMGLYGLVSFMASQKVKEIGIRKVLGASVGGIVALFSKEFVRVILIAFLVAAPLTWYVMHQWLQRFAYRTSIHWSVFVIGIAATVFIALLTVAYRSVRAALSNPVDTLRSE
jgi:putative ABC transport system permease protein